MKSNQLFKNRYRLAALLSLCCFPWFGDSTFGQTPSAPTLSPQSFATQQADNTFNQDSPTAPIARNPLAKLKQTDPSNLLTKPAIKKSVAPMVGYSNRQLRETEIDNVSWKPANLHHRRLLFEDVAIERDNQDRRAGNLAAGMHFFKSLVQLPVRLLSGK